MARAVDRWFAEDGGIACLQASKLLGRLASVPEGAYGFGLNDGEPRLLAGSPLTGPALIVRESEFSVPIRVAGLRDWDGIEGELTATLRVAPPRQRTSALLLRDAFFTRDECLDSGRVSDYLTGPLHRGLAKILVDHPWEGADGLLPVLQRAECLPDILRAPLFEAGLDLVRVLDLSVDSEALDARRARDRELREEAQRVHDRLEFLSLWQREEKGEVLARHDVERLAAHLKKEGLLSEIDDRRETFQKRLAVEREEARARGQLRRLLERERIATQMEIDSERLEFEIEQAKRLEKALEKNGLVGAVHLLDDSAGRARLLELLIQKDMSPEQIAAQSDHRSLASLEARIEGLAAELRAEIRGGSAPRWVDALPSLSRIWIAAGLAVYRVEADAAFAGTRPTPVLPPDDIGYLRFIAIPRGSPNRVLVGAQAGVAVYDPHGSHWMIHRYRPAPRGRGGANSVLSLGHCLLATHSELGLYIWRENRSGNPLYTQRIVPGVSTRAVHVGPGGRAFFAHGREVFALSPDAPEAGLEECGRLPESVTALETKGDDLVAGTRDGRLFRWQGPAQWSALPFRARGPIFRVMAPGVGDDIGWVVGAREPAVHILDADGTPRVDFRSHHPIRWVAAGRQGVVGVDRFGQHLLLWSWDDPRGPRQRIRIPDQITYLAVEGVEA